MRTGNTLRDVHNNRFMRVEVFYFLMSTAELRPVHLGNVNNFT